MQNITKILTEGDFNSSEKGESSNSTKTDDYDHVGAMQFIIVTILVYSTIGVCCTLVVRIRRSRAHKSHPLHVQDEHIQKYLKREKYLKQDGFKMKLSFECDRTRSRLVEMAGKTRLLDIQKSVASPDFAGSSDKGKKMDRRKGGKTRLDSLVGKMGFTLLLVPGVNDQKVEEFELKQNGYVTNSADSSVSDMMSHSSSMDSISEAPELQTLSSILPPEQLHSNDEVFPPSHTYCSSSDNFPHNTLTHIDDISVTALNGENNVHLQRNINYEEPVQSGLCIE